MFYSPDVMYPGESSCELEKNVYSAVFGGNFL